MDEWLRDPLDEQQARQVLDILDDPARTGIVVATTPEEMPVTESLELVERLRGETDIDVASVVVNRVLPELFSHGEEEIFGRLRATEVTAQLVDAVGPGVHRVLDGAQLAVDMRRGSVPHLERLRGGLPEGIPVLYVPYLFHRSHGTRATHRIAEFLGEELL